MVVNISGKTMKNATINNILENEIKINVDDNSSDDREIGRMDKFN